MTVTRQQVFRVLKSLPMIRFALMLGGGGVAAEFDFDTPEDASREEGSR